MIDAKDCGNCLHYRPPIHGFYNEAEQAEFARCNVANEYVPYAHIQRSRPYIPDTLLDCGAEGRLFDPLLEI